ncbi:leucine carboxyl methyltransferase 1 [Cryptococcus floricola]|uniref:Leucine carboxyl methyltransferase 1 n=1 Tax=Cryptococcus floricola TaxID=2591691 RepID=A0A5D3B579_9TREE|nr:leucine carboxyl methyltransferase 1 [Cryptococcus floricola]
MLPPRFNQPQERPPSNHASHPDDAIRLTDDDAASSRLSAAQLGYLPDPFVSLLYRAPMAYGAAPSGRAARKPPLINIGTHHRTWGIDLLVEQFLERGGKQIVSLGAGSDTRFWRLMSRDSPPSIHKYVEVDFPHLTSPKAQRIARHHKLSQYLSPIVPGVSPTLPGPGSKSYSIAQGGTELSSSLFDLIPLDLRPGSSSSKSIPSTLSAELLPHLDPSLPTLFLAECLFPYMPPEDSEAIVGWFGETFKDCVGVVYEMVGLDDSFGKVMRRNLAVRNLSIPGSVFPTPASQAGRFQVSQLGEGRFDDAGARTLWQVREQAIDPKELQRISKLEILDEIEELRLVLEHYVIAWGTKGAGMSSISL